MYKHIIWDFDGTLFNSYPAMLEAMMSLLDDFEIHEERNNILRLMKVSMGHMIEYLKEEYKINEDFINEYTVRREKYESKMLKPFDGVLDICNYIVSNGGDNHLFTHRDQSSIEYLKKFDLYKYFTGLVTKDSGFARKPSPEGIYYLLNKYGLNKDETIMIGDRDIDLLSAKNAGISTCYFKQAGDKPLEIADYVINHFHELKKIL